VTRSVVLNGDGSPNWNCRLYRGALSMAYLAILKGMKVQIPGVESEIRRRVRESSVAHRLLSIPGVGRFGAL